MRHRACGVGQSPLSAWSRPNRGSRTGAAGPWRLRLARGCGPRSSVAAARSSRWRPSRARARSPGRPDRPRGWGWAWGRKPSASKGGRAGFVCDLTRCTQSARAFTSRGTSSCNERRRSGWEERSRLIGCGGRRRGEASDDAKPLLSPYGSPALCGRDRFVSRRRSRHQDRDLRLQPERVPTPVGSLRPVRMHVQRQAPRVGVHLVDAERSSNDRRKQRPDLGRQRMDGRRHADDANDVAPRARCFHRALPSRQCHPRTCAGTPAGDSAHGTSHGPCIARLPIRMTHRTIARCGDGRQSAGHHAGAPSRPLGRRRGRYEFLAGQRSRCGLSADSSRAARALRGPRWRP